MKAQYFKKTHPNGYNRIKKTSRFITDAEDNIVSLNSNVVFNYKSRLKRGTVLDIKISSTNLISEREVLEVKMYVEVKHKDSSRISIIRNQHSILKI